MTFQIIKMQIKREQLQSIKKRGIKESNQTAISQLVQLAIFSAISLFYIFDILVYSLYIYGIVLFLPFCTWRSRKDET